MLEADPAAVARATVFAAGEVPLSSWSALMGGRCRDTGVADGDGTDVADGAVHDRVLVRRLCARAGGAGAQRDGGERQADQSCADPAA